MKLIAVILVALVAVCSSSEYGYRASHYAPGFQHVGNGIASAYRNDVRQEVVNKVAEHYGAGTGTARFVGVPGTNGNYGYGHHAGGYGGYGYARSGPFYGGYGAAYEHAGYRY